MRCLPFYLDFNQFVFLNLRAKKNLCAMSKFLVIFLRDFENKWIVALTPRITLVVFTNDVAESD